jgi:phosphoglycerol transferase
MFFILSTTLSIVSLALTFSASSSRLKRFFLLLILINLIILGCYAFLDSLSGNGINDAVIYHLYFGITGFGVDDYVIPIFIFLLYIVFCFLFIYFSQTHTIQFTGRFNLLKKTIPIFITLSLVLNPFFQNIYELYFKNYSTNFDNKSSNQNFLIQPKDYLFAEKKKNIIYLYLEQFERTYFDESIFPGLTPNLKRLEKEAITFTNISSPKSTNWTISGMVASQCGIPLLVPDYRGNSMSGMDQFLPLANCLGDILTQNGYFLNYVGGSNLEFAGKGQFYSSHGFEVVEGLEELINRKSEKSYLSPWGLFDDTLYKIIEKRYLRLDEDNRLFGIFSLTLDTHHPNGYMSEFCKDLVYRDGKNLILNSVHCADMMAGRFVDSLKSNAAFDNTILVISSDHLALKNSANTMLNRGDRKNLFLIFDQTLSPRVISKPGSMFDIAPTVLSAMGVHSEGLGLGRNLFFESSLSEQDLSIEKIIRVHKKDLLSLWSFPQINSGFEISLENRLINFDARKIKLPVLVLLNDSLEVEEMRFDFYFSNPLINEVKSINKSKNLIWIDRCGPILEFMQVKLALEEIQFCSYIFRKDNDQYLITDLQREVLDFTKINLFFK